MKKFVSIILVLTMVLSLAACGGNSVEETPGTTAGETVGISDEKVPGSALELLETIWADYAEEEKFPVIGGSMANPVDGAPGSYDLNDENITYNLLIPAAQLANVTEAASMIHMMNANTFTCAAYKLADGVDAAQFGEAMRQAIQSNQWMCGFPEILHVGNFEGQYVLVAFGVKDAMDPFNAHLAAVYPYGEVLVNEAIG